jgi:isoquinoline 1-oxidoreductase beta subunit
MRVRQIGAQSAHKSTVSRRGFLVGGAAAGGLLLAWGVWPRSYKPDLNLAPGEQAIGAFLKIDRSGQIIVIVPQAELGQGSYTGLPQILADELGADWRTVAVQPAIPGPLYANSLAARDWLSGTALRATGDAGAWLIDHYAERTGLVLTTGATSVAMFNDALRDAGAGARVLLCKAAGARWNVPWESCDIQKGVVTDGTRTLRIGELASEAAAFDMPDTLPLRQFRGDEPRLIGTRVARIDVPSKVDGTANYAADIRMPGMIFASIRQGPAGGGRLLSANEDAARKVAGVIGVVRTDEWVAVTGTNWWAANQGLGRLDPVFQTNGVAVEDAGIKRALKAAIAGGEGERFFARGDLGPVFDKAQIVTAHYSVAPALHLALEPQAVTARVTEGGVELWMASQAPGLARRAVARALDLAEAQVTIYPLFAGGSFGRRLEADAAVQAALIAREAKAPVQLQWSRSEDITHDRPGPPAYAELHARLGRGGIVEGWQAKVAVPAALPQTWRRIAHGDTPRAAMAATVTTADRSAVAGMDLPYAIANFAVDHHPAQIALPTGAWRSGAEHYGCFFSESFIDELAQVAGVEPMSFRIQMLGTDPRLAHCLTTVAAMGGWQGAAPGSGQGIACHRSGDSAIAVLIGAALEGGRVKVRRMIAAVDCGTVINPDLVRQQVEGGMLFGLAAALGGAGRYRKGMPLALQMGEMGHPVLGDIGEVSVEIVSSTKPPSGAGTIGVPPVAPALASALHSLTGRRWRSLPFAKAG